MRQEKLSIAMQEEPTQSGDAAAVGSAGDRPMADALRRLKGVVLLSGSVRAVRLSDAVGASLLDLPIDSDSSLMDLWRRQVAELAGAIGPSPLAVRVLVDQNSAAPQVPEDDGGAAFTVERDPYDYRGTGGVLRDLANEYEPDDYLLVANGAQVLVDPLHELAGVLASLGADVGLVAHDDGTPSGLTLIRCGALDSISPAGFVDLKEQALPTIARRHSVRVVHRSRATGLPIRTRLNYLDALRTYHSLLADRPEAADPFAENIESTFSIVQGGATVDPEARVHESVVFPGARVEAGAILVRSLVCPGAVVRRNQRVVDRVLPSPGRSPARWNEEGERR